MKNLPRIEHWVERIDGLHVAVHAERAWDVPCRSAVFVIVLAAEYRDWQKQHAIREAVDRRLHDFERQLFSYYGGKRFVKQFSLDAEGGYPYRGSTCGAIASS